MFKTSSLFAKSFYRQAYFGTLNGAQIEAAITSLEAANAPETHSHDGHHHEDKHHPKESKINWGQFFSQIKAEDVEKSELKDVGRLLKALSYASDSKEAA